MLRYTLRQLTYFVVTAENGSVARAAAALHVSQPSVSTAIAKLEEQFGVQLFIRHHAQGVTLTPRGRKLVREARNLLRHAAELQENAKTIGDALLGSIDIGCYFTLAAAYMPNLLNTFRAKYPSVTVTLTEGNQPELVAGLESGRFELALLYAHELPHSLHLDVLVELQPYVLLPEHHPLTGQKRLSLADLADEPLVLLDIPPGRGYFLSLFESLGITPNLSFSSSSFEMVRGMVGSGAGYSVLITRPQSDRTHDGHVVKACPIADATPPALVALARLPQTRPTRLAECFVEFCEKAFSSFDKNRRCLRSVALWERK